MTDDLVNQLWESDEASALTNRAARRIEELEAREKAIVRAALERAALEVEVLTGECVDPHVKVWAENQAQSIRLLADNDAEVAAILLKAARGGLG
jgi:hypothetical protein